MNANAYLRLAWKEYRAARAFWLAVVGLAIAAQWLAMSQAFGLAALYAAPWVAVVTCNIALAAPVFFALGCAGATFAVEREEGTFDFLRAAPISAGQVLATKLGLTLAATVAMYALLWPLALWFTGGLLPEAATLRGMLGLWLLAAAEAIAWGTLFSLLTARPLAAVCLALVATSTIAHLLAWSVAGGPGYQFGFEHYLDAAGWRALVVAAVAAADVYLGLRWLDERAAPVPRKPKRAVARAGGDEADDARAAACRAIRPERSAMLVRLVWQSLRQSWRLMLLLAGLQIVLTFLVLHGGFEDSDELPVVPLAAMAAVMGSAVFLADQERRQHRFFVEHNVPPRCVWLSRQLPWMLTLVVSSIAAGIVWLGPVRFAYTLYATFGRVDPRAFDWQFGSMSRPPYALVAAWVAVSYAAGQWTSMMLRSGLLAGFYGLLAAGVLCGWVFLMYVLQMSWLWTVAPLPAVLLGATWLRAPDWVRENASWRARGKAAASVLAPAFALCLLVPYYRVQQIPIVFPGFHPHLYAETISANAIGGAVETAALYRRANELYTSRMRHDDDAWLELNAEPLELLLQASRRPHCLLDDPRKSGDTPPMSNRTELISLLIASGRQLQAKGRLDLALERYFTAIQVISHWTEGNANGSLFSAQGRRLAVDEVNRVLDELPGWAAAEGQTVERIRAALARVEALDAGVLHLDDRLKSAYLLARRNALGDRSVEERLYSFQAGHPYLNAQLLWGKLMPWEKHRELRSLDVDTRDAIALLDSARRRLAAGSGYVHFVTVDEREWYRWWPEDALFHAAGLMRHLETLAVSELVKFEDWRRARRVRAGRPRWPAATPWRAAVARRPGGTVPRPTAARSVLGLRFPLLSRRSAGPGQRPRSGRIQ